jgi:2-keto-4-pentenoate hydratase
MCFQGEPLCKGEVLLSGALGPMVSVIKGDDIRMDMDGFASIHLTIN